MHVVYRGAPTFDVVALDMFKKHARVEHNVEDVVIAAHLAAAVAHVEERTETTLARRDLTAISPMLASGAQAAFSCMLQRPPFVQVDAVRLVREDSTVVAPPPDDYRADPEPGGFGWFRWLDGKGALHASDTAARIEIDYQAGYADAAGAPPQFVHAVMELATRFYEHRQAGRGVTIGVAEMPFSVTQLTTRGRRRIFV